MNNLTKYILAGVLLLVGVIAYFYFTSGYGKTSKLGYEFALALDQACNQKDLERVRKVEMLINEYAEKKEISVKEKGWLDSIIQLANDGKWEKAQKNARQLLDAQIEHGSQSAKPKHDHSN